MNKVDFKRELGFLYNPPKGKFLVVDVPPMNFLMLDGHGNPNTSADYQAVMEALYAMAYGIKFALKPEGVEYVVPPLEGLWFSASGSGFDADDKDSWDWTMMVMQPPQVTPELVDRMREETLRKKGLAALERLRFESYHEGLSAQIMYLVPYSDEGPTIMALHEFIAAQGCRLRGKHHEIYMGDPRRTAPEKLKTIIRQPMEK